MPTSDFETRIINGHDLYCEVQMRWPSPTRLSLSRGDRLRVGWLNGFFTPTRVIYHQVYQDKKITGTVAPSGVASSATKKRGWFKVVMAVAFSSRAPRGEGSTSFGKSSSAIMCPAQKVDVRLPGKWNSNSHGARPVHLIITMIKWIRTSRMSMKNSLSAQEGVNTHSSQKRFD